MAKFSHAKVLAAVFIAPQLLITLVLFIWPAARACFQSFFFSDAFGLHKQFAGFVNFNDLFHDPSFINALWVTLLIAFFVSIVTLSLGLLLAALVQGRKKSQRLYKALFLWPYAVAPAVAAILWRFICQPTLGWLSHILSLLGIDFNYLIHTKQALAVIILTASWQQFSYNFLFFLVALKAVPQSILDAATLDGASAWRRFWQITFPLLSPTTFFLLIINVIYAFFDTFGIIDVLTKGGPGNSTTSLVYKIYKDGFVGMDPGGSATQSVILMLVIMGLTLLQFRYFEQKVHYT